MSRYDSPNPLCRHKPAGTMSWPPELDSNDPRPHVGTVVCLRSACQDDAAEWVKAVTGHRGEFRTFEQNRARHRVEDTLRVADQQIERWRGALDKLGAEDSETPR